MPGAQGEIGEWPGSQIDSLAGVKTTLLPKGGGKEALAGKRRCLWMPDRVMISHSPVARARGRGVAKYPLTFQALVRRGIVGLWENVKQRLARNLK